MSADFYRSLTPKNTGEPAVKRRLAGGMGRWHDEATRMSDAIGAMVGDSMVPFLP